MVSYTNLDRAIQSLILSPSGWRAVFASGSVSDTDGVSGTGDKANEESASPNISPAHRIIIARAARVFAEYLHAHLARPVVVVGMDTRPTGPAIAHELIGGLLSADCDVKFAGFTAAPEIMAYARSGGVNGFVYISASHNPIGHNGLKFGLDDGGVLPASEAKKLIAAFLANKDYDDGVAPQLNKERLLPVLKKWSECKRSAYQAYLAFSREVTQGDTAGGDILAAISTGLKARPLGITVDFNGSARTLSIDREFFESLGIRLHAMNDKPGMIAHRIVPEGESLEPCCRYLEELHATDSSIILGYVPDCDGDRGNLVIWDQGEQRARSLEAQEVFALACAGELAQLVWSGVDTAKAAIAVNDPTSMRVDRIAEAFGTSVFHAEVGEANVVELARSLRKRGYIARILGEGSAGGNITHPSAVRDPIQTVMAIVKLLCVRSNGDKAGLFEIWRKRAGKVYSGDFSLLNIITTLPAFYTTGSYTPEAALQVKSADHAALKERYQAVFLREWEARKPRLAARYGLTQWEVLGYNGMEEKRGLSRFGEAGRGGLKLMFRDAVGNEVAWMWMRGSGTEPVFRVMADAYSVELERELIQWQRAMVIEADGNEVSGGV
ncbi:MAG: phosphatidylglycerol lysyltransferase [Treponema sp.]|jgi:phosphoglucomutase|nr:phosphatidylglycerol lysyltransferase [Treponema sp.]